MSKIDNKTALDELLLSQEKREALEVLGIPLAKLNQFIKAYNGDLEVLGIPSAKFNQFIKAYNDDLENVLCEMSSTVDVLEILNEGVN